MTLLFPNVLFFSHEALILNGSNGGKRNGRENYSNKGGTNNKKTEQIEF